MRYPKFLKENGTIGFIAPSFGAVIEPYNSLFINALKKFESMGYSVALGPNCFEDKGIGKSNTPEECAEEINDYFMNDLSDIIISCGGGETMCEDLNYVDFEGIKEADPKWYMGYSDNTNLTFILPTLCDTAAIYGPCASNFGMEPWHESIQDAFDVLTGKNLKLHNYDKWELNEKEVPEGETPNLLEPYNCTENFELQYGGSAKVKEIGAGNELCKEGTAGEAAFSGRLIGGCLDCLQTLCGTKFDKVKEFNEKYKEDGIIWFIEACDLSTTAIRRAIWQLDSAGWFENAKGFIIGRPRIMEPDGMGFDRFSAVEGVLQKYNVPILYDVDLGHLPPMMPLISGAMADVKAKGNSLSINMRLE